jgi:hypothetical protein
VDKNNKGLTNIDNQDDIATENNNENDDDQEEFEDFEEVDLKRINLKKNILKNLAIMFMNIVLKT